jgi:AraC-like DNA-binding protein/mannose-6-phosphate isomerase-like protein (cupin superfamily)
MEALRAEHSMSIDGASWRPFGDRIRDFLAKRGEDGYLHAASGATCGHRARRAVTVTRHTSDCCEFFLVVEGRARLETPAETFELTPGKLLLVDPGVEHEELPASPDDPYLVFCFMAQDTTADLFQTLYLPHTRDNVLSSRLRLVGSEPVEEAARLVGVELAHRRAGWAEAAGHLVQYLGLLLQRRVASGSFEYATRTMSTALNRNHPLEAALFYCSANIHRPIRLEDVAAAVGYSPSYLSPIFSQSFGISFSEHLRTLRLGIAESLLSHSDLPVQEIARRVGYQYPWHFTRAFTQAMGMSPREYRRAHAAG